VKDINILKYVANSAWAILPDKWAEMMPALMRHVRGESLSAEELQAALGDTRSQPPTSSKRGAIAVIPIRGVIAHRMNALDDSSGGTSAERIGAMLKAVAADDSIGTIVYDVDSPGGSVTGMQELAQQMFELRGQKNQIAVANGLMASAAYWLASQADEIIAIPSATVGSIGVFTAHQDLSAALEKEGIKVTLISAGKFKTEGNPFEPLSDEARQFMQDRVDVAYSQFTKDVARGRGVSASDVRGGYGQGRALPAKDAKAAGLVDRIATMDDTLARLSGQRMAGGMRAEADAEMQAIASREAALADTVDALATDDDVERRINL
jgi:signal peptide peptidase SppA